ncbi:MAG: nucleotidyltransferase domain-containing protein [Desulfatiglans sp.]|jgi:predicted nucleotidyltransferase|nr:nucleotidyltransferase domain-containing protein [Desulfatiglans sp.]
MRLTEKEKRAILESVRKLDPHAEVYLFGSRTDMLKKGGDIDILVLSDQLEFFDKLAIKAALFERIEEQKVDLLIARHRGDPFVKLALEKGVRLQ